MRPGDTRHVTIKVTDATGAGITGLVLGNFTVRSKKYPAGGSAWEAWSPSTALTEDASGYYYLDFTLPSAACEWDFRIEHASYDVANGHWEGELESYDIDYIYSRVIRPVATATTDFSLGATVALDVVAYRHQVKTVVVEDDNGNPVTLDTTYENFILCIKNADQTKSWEYKYDGGAWKQSIDGGAFSPLTDFSIAWNDSGELTITFPETCDFYSQATAADRPKESGLYYDVRADLKTTSKTCAIIRSSAFGVYVSEGGAS